MNVKTRFPPSPTGFLHVGSLRTALYNYYFAKKHGGTFVLRVEDTDQARYVAGSVESLIRVLDRMSIQYDEGPILKDGEILEKGLNGPYMQSARLPIYQEHAKRLVESGNAYYCFCSKERLEELRSVQQVKKQPTKYDRHCFKLDQKEAQDRVQAGESYVIRMRIPDGKTMFQDEIRGTITIDNAEIDDQVLVKADGFPTYHLAVVVDDNAMGVTHVIRGEEWLSSVPKHMLLYEWFQFPKPVFAHLPLILNPNKSKLSKRQGDVSVEDFLKKGFLEEALCNFVSLLGFNPTSDREIYTREEFIEAFDLKKINKSGAVFDINKLLWMNAQYLKTINTVELVDRLQPFLDREVDTDRAVLERVCDIEKSRMNLLSDIRTILPMYRSQPNYSADILVWKKADREDAGIQLKNIKDFLIELPDAVFESAGLINDNLKGYIESRSLQNGNVFWPLRVALSGSERSAGPHEIIWVLGRKQTLSRIDHALHLLS